ncbi:MAG: hypothetical protein HETSPECPRED_008363 [Heterodermia speciosa]|uniref:N-acetyltransferase domain-containing protein n=1 Tax=Heterodermia speciosa TaxID=116794 RepID=A0A8H3IXH7_9LECA|nr:MAG: hypothetical protein HETSPECPRED_008363 [Heterodermia speciosa]
MKLRVTTAAEPDADRIAAVHMAAFGTNALLRAQFPSSNIRTKLWKCIAAKAAADIRDPNIAVLVVRDQEDRIISFAKWSLPVTLEQDHGSYTEKPWRWPEGSNFPVLDEWAAKLERAHRNVLGETPSYPGARQEALLTLFYPDLTFIGTDPQYERRGAATALIQWGLDRCCESGAPAYLESTLGAVQLYERLGFKIRHRVSIVLEGAQSYEEACCVFQPRGTMLAGQGLSDGDNE